MSVELDNIVGLDNAANELGVSVDMVVTLVEHDELTPYSFLGKSGKKFRCINFFDANRCKPQFFCYDVRRHGEVYFDCRELMACKQKLNAPVPQSCPIPIHPEAKPLNVVRKPWEDEPEAKPKRVPVLDNGVQVQTNSLKAELEATKSQGQNRTQAATSARQASLLQNWQEAFKVMFAVGMECYTEGEKPRNTNEIIRMCSKRGGNLNQEQIAFLRQLLGPKHVQTTGGAPRQG